ncbi:MAG: tRNA (guanosine(46)-N7)-methyltransferase TrmB [Gammaproteobacteria bacterium]|nr:tRNA (guanosine(46)-N7)-methyltransferase TrmB [Gammaproteobacteria bacterium]
MVDKSKWRHIRSFVRREGRLTKAQQQALDLLGPKLMLEPSSGQLDLDSVFGRTAPRYLEIGFGDGKSLAHMAAAQPEVDFLGVEVHRPGVGSLLIQVERQSFTNVRVICADVVEVLKNMIPDASLDKVFLFFPDPWHKKRHHKRRLVQPDFVAMLKSKLKPDGVFHMATDWEDYAIHMLSVMKSAPGFKNMASDGGYVMRPEYRPLTKFEARGQRLGHGVWDLMFRRTDDAE